MGEEACLSLKIGKEKIKGWKSCEMLLR